MTERLATLWIGPPLSFLELICLKSMHDVGQTPILYRYEPIGNEPDFVEVRDAREVFHTEEVKSIYGKERLDDPRLWSDIFRIKLMQKTSHIWVDADVFALQKHTSKGGYLYARKHGRSGGFIPNGVLRLPKNSQGLKLLADFVVQKGQIPPWWTEITTQEYLNLHPEVSFETLPLGITGPKALGYFLGLTGEHNRALTFEALYPLAARQKKELLVTPRCIGPDSYPDSLSIHLYATGIRRRLMRTSGVPKKGSLLDYLCDQTGIDASQNPVTHRD